MTIFIKNKQTLIINEFRFKCSIGKNGICKKKIEGDKKTPKGLFALGNLYYRPDRLSKPKTSLKTFKIKKNMGWSHDTRYPKYYNKLIDVNKNIRHEKLFRKD